MTNAPHDSTPEEAADTSPETTPSPEATPSADAMPSADADDLQTLRAELEQARAQHQRALADYQNLERRSREERAEVGRMAVIEVVRGILPVLDDLERALDSVTGDDEPGRESWTAGVRLVAQKFKQALQQLGVEETPALGVAFDPMKHEAVGAAPGPEGQVAHVLQRGYTLGGRVLRPSMVMVGDGSTAATNDEDRA